MTPLLLAANRGAFETCIALLGLGSDPEAQDKQGRNLLHLLMFFCGRGLRTILPAFEDVRVYNRIANFITVIIDHLINAHIHTHTWL